MPAKAPSLSQVPKYSADELRAPTSVQEITHLANANGLWPPHAMTELARFTGEGKYEDADVQANLREQGVTDVEVHDCVYTTLLALWLLKKYFRNQAEILLYKPIEDKAKKSLKEKGVEKIDKLISLFKLKTVERRQ